MCCTVPKCPDAVPLWDPRPATLYVSHPDAFHYKPRILYMAKNDPAKDQKLTIKIDKDEHAMLSQLARDESRSMASVIRENIRSRFRMRYANEPRCARDQPCLCPNMHSLVRPDAPSDAELIRQAKDENASSDNLSAA